MAAPGGTAWRVVFSDPADGAFNMAADEAILEAAAAGAVPPTLRFFDWAPPTLSLGYAQPAADCDRENLARLGWGLVRRPTGGRAILHTDELTYSVAAPEGDPAMRGGVLESYRRLSRGLLAGLRRLGLDAADSERASGRRSGAVCFEVPSDYEITAGGRKLIGSAQCRKAGGVLQHGTLPLRGDLARILNALRAPAADPARIPALAERVRARAITLEEALGQPVAWREAADALRRGFAETLGLEFEEAPLSDAETARAHTLASEKYGNENWTARV